MNVATDNLLGIKAKNTVQLVRAIGKGFSFGMLEHVCKETGLPLDRLTISIGMGLHR